MSLQPPRMTTLTRSTMEGFLDPKVRDWLYTIALAVGPLLIGREAMETDEWELWLALVGSILVPGVARMNIDYSLTGRKPAGQHSKRELGREGTIILDPSKAEKVTEKVTPIDPTSNVDALTYLLGRLEKLDKGQQALADQLSHWEVVEINLADPGPEEPSHEPVGEEVAGGQFTEEDEPAVVYDAVRRGQELQADRLADDPREDPTVPPEHRP